MREIKTVISCDLCQTVGEGQDPKGWLNLKVKRFDLKGHYTWEFLDLCTRCVDSLSSAFRERGLS